ncbi:alpha-amylase family protein [Georgenia alba]|uniref:Alpha-amylase family protein n=1 Tax=Georgenia alba TaxID=2233858 RepID=A0ABW2Q8F3_9MICO
MTSTSTSRTQTAERPWFADAVIYQVDPNLFADSDGDGHGDLRGLTARLEHVRDLGATCVWILPFYGTPYRDGGYDVSDHRTVDPLFGTMEDLDRLVARAHELGLHVMTELVVQHTSDQHRWFRQARRDPGSPYRDYYVWADHPEETDVEPIFPGVEDSVWAWDQAAGRYYRHLFYSHEPDLDLSRDVVREEIAEVADLWLDHGVDGFRVDAVPSIIERTRAADPTDHGLWWLDELRDHVESRHPEIVLMGEVDEQPEEYVGYFGGNHRLNLILNFWINNHVFLALARGEAGPIVDALEHQPDPPPGARYANWLRNHDELDLERLTDAERAEVFAAFAPEPEMQLYGRGIRRRLSPMLGGDDRWEALAHAVMLSLPGVPVLRYGDEVGQGEDLSRPERTAVRTPMQWTGGRNAGFSESVDGLAAPLVTAGIFDYRRRNVADQERDPASLLHRIRAMVQARRSLPETTGRTCRPLDVGASSVLALHHGADGGPGVVLLANLSAEPAVAELSAALPGEEVLADEVSRELAADGDRLPVAGHGYRWLRVRS